MTPSNNLNVIAFYDDIELQDRQRWWVDTDNPLTVELDTIPPFQILCGYGTASITSFKLVRLDDGTETDILDNVICTGLEHISVDTDYDLIIYPSTSTYVLVNQHLLRSVRI